MKELTAIELVEKLYKSEKGVKDLVDWRVGIIVCKWLSEADNISEAMEVVNGFGREQMIEFFKFAGSLVTKEDAMNTFQEAVGQSPYGRDILSMLVKQVEDKLEKQAAIAKYED